MKLRCCVIDDEPPALAMLENYVLKTPFLELVGKFPSALLAMEELSMEQVDLLFLDIQMPELNGLEFSKMVGDKTKVIFTTAFEQYAVDSYKVNALDYLLKPISYADFLQAANKALQWFEMSRQPSAPEKDKDSIFVKSDYKLMKIDLKDILYIEGLRDYVKIYLEGEKNPIVSLMSMKSLEDLLPANRFFRVHRSYIVNGDQIKLVERNRIVFDKVYIPVSDSYKERFYSFLSERSLNL